MGFLFPPYSMLCTCIYNIFYSKKNPFFFKLIQATASTKWRAPRKKKKKPSSPTLLLHSFHSFLPSSSFIPSPSFFFFFFYQNTHNNIGDNLNLYALIIFRFKNVLSYRNDERKKRKRRMVTCLQRKKKI